MDTKQIVIGTIVGSVTLYIVGYLIFDVAVADFYAANRGPATGAFRDAPLQWAAVLSNVSYAALVTLGVASRAGAPTIVRGIVTGGVIGFLLWFCADFYLYGYFNTYNLTVASVDPLLEFVHAGIGGAVIAAVLARIPKAA